MHSFIGADGYKLIVIYSPCGTLICSDGYRVTASIWNVLPDTKRFHAIQIISNISIILQPWSISLSLSLSLDVRGQWEAQK